MSVGTLINIPDIEMDNSITDFLLNVEQLYSSAYASITPYSCRKYNLNFCKRKNQFYLVALCSSPELYRT